ncbi:serine/threonine-protein kinase, partial [Streptomyces sp. SM5]
AARTRRTGLTAMFSPLTHDDPVRIGGYRPVARLGGGGMGTVYLARSADGRTAALKTMHARLATDPVSRGRFRLETDAARIIGPVHGARVLDADPSADIPWLATEYVLGPGLDEAVSSRGPLPEPAVRALGALLCAALTQLHRSDVVHRDLKPSNIMLTVDGPKLIDFGIARADGDDHLTRTGTAAGTPAFMSPEQAIGQEHTAAGDVFALAGVLTYAATGHGPFGTGQPADLLYRVRYAEPDLTGLPPALAPVLGQALGKVPAGRSGASSARPTWRGRSSAAASPRSSAAAPRADGPGSRPSS